MQPFRRFALHLTGGAYGFVSVCCGTCCVAFLSSTPTWISAAGSFKANAGTASADGKGAGPSAAAGAAAAKATAKAKDGKEKEKADDEADEAAALAAASVYPPIKELGVGLTADALSPFVPIVKAIAKTSQVKYVCASPLSVWLTHFFGICLGGAQTRVAADSKAV